MGGRPAVSAVASSHPLWYLPQHSPGRNTAPVCCTPSPAADPEQADGGYMRVWHSIARRGVPRRFTWLACALVLALAPMTLTGQAPRGQARRRAGTGPQGRGAPDVGGQNPEPGNLRHSSAGAGCSGYLAALPERVAVEHQPRQEVVLQPGRRRPGADGHVREAVPRAGRGVHRLQGEPRADADNQQQRRNPGDLRHRRDEEACRHAAQRARVERHVVARWQVPSRTSSTPRMRRTSG